MKPTLDRRRWIMGVSAGAAAAAGLPHLTGSLFAAQDADPQPDRPNFRYCLNTSTIRGQNLSIEAEIDLAAKAGYDGIEPWLNKLLQHQTDGGKLSDLRKRLDDHGLQVEGAIGFANWISDDEATRRKGLENARRDMEVVAAIGGSRIAAPPVGATREPGLDLFAAAERFGKLVEVGDELGVAPQLELWGFSKNLSRIGELLMVASECGHDDVGVLPDVYHIYKGGSPFSGLAMIPGSAIHLFHMNDYPLDPPREKIGDADRVYPGDGKAPLSEILQLLHRNGFSGALSLELFNREYWKADPLEVARNGLKKMQGAVEAAFAGA